ncbi:hypothetical protein MicloDRAFT_00003840 [Microvirga lotononidis]|uniref:Uncharacterized protein n=1 Tax=Microvirga lotononidis TaxID=864069 RepID=I4Z3R5_9HYPH|nr:hypothetical protein MicloDRAFT_00003840 [Microvirga lotononidis]
MKAVAERCLAEVLSCKSQTGRLIRSLLSEQALDFTLKSRDSTLTTVSPVLKGLRLLEGFWRMASFDHLHTKQSCSASCTNYVLLKLPRPPAPVSGE